MAKPTETFGRYLHRRRFEMGRELGARIRQRDFAAMIEKKLANPLVTVSPNKLNTWENDRAMPRPEVVDAIRKVLGT